MNEIEMIVVIILSLIYLLWRRKVDKEDGL